MSNQKFEENTTEALDSLDARLTTLEGVVARIDGRVCALKARLDATANLLDVLDELTKLKSERAENLAGAVDQKVELVRAMCDNLREQVRLMSTQIDTLGIRQAVFNHTPRIFP